MGMTITLSIGCAALIAAVFCGWRGALPPDPRRGVRLVPWRFLMLLSGALLVLILVHLAGLLGLHSQS